MFRLRARLGRLAACSILAAASSSSVGMAAPPAGDENLSVAREAFRKGVEAQDAGQYADALALYRSVAEVAISPALLFDIGSCQEQLGQLLEASDSYHQALGLARERSRTDVERESSARIALLDVQIPFLVVRYPAGDDGLTAFLDEKPVSLESLGHLAVNPGSHRLLVRSKSSAVPFETAFEIEARSERVIDVRFERAASPPVPQHASISEVLATAALEPSREERPSYVPAWVAGGLGLALGAGAVVTGLEGRSKVVRYESLNADPSDANRPEREDLRSAGQHWYIANTVLSGAALVAAGTAVYFIVRPPKHTMSATARVGIGFARPILSFEF